MPTSKENRTYASRFKTDVSVDQTTNTGFDSTTRLLVSGDGASSAASLSDDVLSVQPINDDTTGTMLVKNSGGSNIFSVDTYNSRVLCGSSQVNALTQYQTFSGMSLTPTAGYHYPLTNHEASYHASQSVSEWHLSNGAKPAETLDISEEGFESNNIIPHFWYLIDAIKIMSAKVIMGGSGAADSILNFHLMSYDIDTSSNFGDLSNGVVIGFSGTTSAVDEDVIKIDDLNNFPTSVAANKVIMATVESDTTQILSLQMIIKYHIL